MNMKKNNFVLILSAAILLFFCGCKENTLDSNEILRRIRLRNNPDAVMADLVAALQKGKAKALYTLSTDRLQNITENTCLFADKEMEFGEILKRQNEYLQQHYSVWLLSSKLVKKDDKVCIYDLIMQKPDSQETKTIQVKLVLDNHKNWKNDTRF